MASDMSALHGVCVIVTNVPAAEASGIAHALVSARHAACVNMLPGVKSVYRWEGEVIEDEETCLLIKAPHSTREACIAELIALHPYSTPEVLVVEPEEVHVFYAAWVHEVTQPAPTATTPEESSS